MVGTVILMRRGLPTTAVMDTHTSLPVRGSSLDVDNQETDTQVKGRTAVNAASQFTVICLWQPPALPVSFNAHCGATAWQFP